MRFVYYGKFFEYFEQGRSDLLRSVGLPYKEIEAMGLILPVIEAHAEYRKAAHYDDLLRIVTFLREKPVARVRIDYEVYRDGETEVLAQGYTIHTFVTAATGKPVARPRAVPGGDRGTDERTGLMETGGAVGRAIEEALREDLGMGDVTGEAVIPEAAPGSGQFLCKADGVVAGLEVAETVFRILDPSVSFARRVEEGASVNRGLVLAAVSGQRPGCCWRASGPRSTSCSE